MDYLALLCLLSYLPHPADVPPGPQDTAIIMYTSGSTGNPKGVLLTHENLVSSLVAYSVVMEVNPDDVYLAYLPLAHVLELMGGEMVICRRDDIASEVDTLSCI